MPVQKVNFFVETFTPTFEVISPAKINSSPEMESLILEVQTNGSITPTQAVSDASNILETMFSSLKISDSKPDNYFINESLKIDKPIDVNDTLIEELELSVRAFNCLKRANINTIGELLKYSPEELLEFKNFGKKSADEVIESLSKRFNLYLNSK